VVAAAAGLAPLAAGDAAAGALVGAGVSVAALLLPQAARIAVAAAAAVPPRKARRVRLEMPCWFAIARSPLRNCVQPTPHGSP
jgi:hypothetical protein